MYLGIDLGTSGIKVVLIDENQQLICSQTESLEILRPQPLWSEQHPYTWWKAVNTCLKKLNSQFCLKQVKAIGLTGQMHGAVLLDREYQVLYPAILWNDNRSYLECKELEELVPHSRNITGNIMMPGFTAPKIRWLKKNKPEIFSQIAKILLPKDYLRLLMTGKCVTDMSDASGTMWLNVKKRCWSNELLVACNLTQEQMPILLEGNQISGYLLPKIAKQWGMMSVPVISGAGDNAAGAIGAGIYQANQAMLSLGTSGVYFVVSDKFVSNPEQAVHSFCHCLPQRWHLMSVILSASSCIDWANHILGINDINRFFQLASQASHHNTIFLPYLSGERTPHNNALAKGVFWGMDHNTDQIIMANAVIEGVTFALYESIQALHNTGIIAHNITLIGGGSKSHFWRQLLANVTGQTFEYRKGGDVGPALGAAKLAQITINPERPISEICSPLPIEHIYKPEPEKYQYYQKKLLKFKQLYQIIKQFH